MVQDYLTLGWTVRLPLLQTHAPCALAATTLTSVLGAARTLHSYVYVDFASGSGGPTPYIERHVNRQLESRGEEPVAFVMTDISPHVAAWEGAVKKSGSGFLGFVAEGVDATRAPAREVLLRGVPGGDRVGKAGKKGREKRVMRLFSLAFHHFDDELAVRVLRDTMERGDAFCIFELQSRNLASLFMVSLLWPLAMLLAPIYFWRRPAHLFFTYLVPLVPFVWVFDGLVSCLRTRTVEEIEALMVQAVGEEGLRGWKVRSGEEVHTVGIGKLYWSVVTKED
ncbi:uncharacterized protein HMPREF1541_10519 [Cyphellophora europaea CBS 101466]|uniref:Uncharacterized protein n=1 Tax=Cyphellophora europaea (strain CBS 101466) TaxID=1220924 RepID=W2S8U1_CYPE1|nr:uncharacterized protein HMPREF1541_10519 [Cyphellophora europaea CBS 101466]ETN44339.1 hypothetical protein HMPREF1541_10519 [Cyphellophora europaea CBS 101466]